MAHLSIALLGLGRFGASVGLALKRHAEESGRNTFDIVGNDRSQDTEKRAEKMGAIDTIEHKLHEAVRDKDIIVISDHYEEARELFRRIAPDMRDGVVVLDASPVKRPSLEWAKEFFSEEQHLIGITPIYNPKYLWEPRETVDYATEDLFEDSTIILTPSVSTVKPAVDLAFNFCQILGSKPRFLDPIEHDVMLAYTNGLPKLMGGMIFQMLLQQSGWEDLQWFTNPPIGAVTRPLHDTHADALRDEWLNNKDVLTRAMDELIERMQNMRDILAEGDMPAVEALSAEITRGYDEWINRRFRADWDKQNKVKVEAGNTLLGSMFGQGIMKRFTGGDDDDNK